MARDSGQWQVVPLDEATQVGAARRAAAALAELTRLPEVAAGQLGLIVVELATNLLKHARNGRLFLRGEGEGAQASVDVVAIDRGAGMDLERCFRDGFSTGGTSGTGLGAVTRAATLFDAWSDARGSVVFARIGTQEGPRRGSLCVAVHGERDSGDGWQYVPTDEGWSVAVVDGLGHGPGAAAASAVALEVHGEWAHAPARCLTLIHERSRSTRGSACSVLARDARLGTIVYAGIGNVVATVAGIEGSRGLAGQNGTLGLACPTVREIRQEIPPGALVVMHTDGLSARWSLQDYPGLRTRHPQVIAGVLFRDAQRPRDDATILVIET